MRERSASLTQQHPRTVAIEKYAAQQSAVSAQCRRCEKAQQRQQSPEQRVATRRRVPARNADENGGGKERFGVERHVVRGGRRTAPESDNRPRKSLTVAVVARERVERERGKRVRRRVEQHASPQQSRIGISSVDSDVAIGIVVGVDTAECV